MINISKYLALRYFEDGIFHRNAKHLIRNADDLNQALSKLINLTGNIGLLLSGGMDSAILAKYVPKTTLAFTFKYENDFEKEEYERAKYYAEINGLKLIDINITWDKIKDYIEPLIKKRGGPIATIEPQLFIACKTAKDLFGINTLIHGGDADVVFGGLSKMLSTDWDIDSFIEFYIYNDPKKILKESNDLHEYVIKKYYDSNRRYFDTIRFINEVYETESTISYENPRKLSGVTFIDPFTPLKFNIDINKVRVKPKYIIQELFTKLYGFEPPEKNPNPIPRPVDFYDELNKYPTSNIFRPDIRYNELTGQQKWMIYCVDKYMGMID